MPADTTLTRSGAGSPHVAGRAYCTTVTLSSGSATLTFTDIEGIDGSLDTEPYVFATGPTGGEAVSSKGTSQCTVTGDTTDDVEVLVVVPDE
ncbi:hypothetical protein M201_gp34 [Haloarcula californiae tailed virus 2]|uniref:Uncharacterized protein n=1 Tax=Haloarcula californiae tailed virus 2 TaxID=1273747 RepID=R4TA41_9CAUD|nr:hypothetical protein M201_gp34 [Haloarcula californiae tailed virus 2]AGM11805.1 hypothetical protein HCTV2_34 [Haloarcula californiae tailed virus 2]